MLLKGEMAVVGEVTSSPPTASAVIAATGLRVERVGGVGEVDRATWNAVVAAGGGGVFHTHEWLTAFEAAPPGRFEPAHLLAYDGERLVGLCPAYLTHECPRLEYALSLDAPAAMRVDGPVLLAHSLAAGTGGPVAVPGHGAALAALAAGLEQAAVDLGAWAAGYAGLLDGPFAGRLVGAGYAVAEIATRYVVPVRWKTVDDYWASLPGRRRRRLQHERRQFLRTGHRLALGETSAEDAVRLVHALLAGRGTPLDVLPADFLLRLHSEMAPLQRSVVTTDDGGTVRALFGGYAFAGQWSLWLAGLDTDTFAAYEPYHAGLAEVVESAVADGIEFVDLGRANGTVKARYGAVPQPLLLALRSGDRARDALLHLWCRQLEQHHHAALNGLETTSRCC